MKFFNNLPKTTFSTTVGDFTISNFFTFLDIENIFFDTTETIIDNKTTLVEAAARVYADPNSIWAFLAANNTVNPFDLLAENTVLFQEENQQKVNFLLFPTAGATTGGSAFSVGSIVVPYIANTGGTASYGSTGNFNINGAFARIQNSSFYNGDMTIGKQFGGTGSFITTGTGITTEQVVVLQQNSDGSYSWGGIYYTSNKKSAPDVVVYIEDLEEGKTIFKQPQGSNITVDSLLEEESGPVLSPDRNRQNVTANTIVDNTAKTIQTYVTNSLGVLRSSFITAKYN
jgi:hypothetical protein